MKYFDTLTNHRISLSERFISICHLNLTSKKVILPKVSCDQNAIRRYIKNQSNTAFVKHG